MLGVSVLAVVVLRWSQRPRLRLRRVPRAFALVILAVALTLLRAADDPASSLRLPFGLPWIGAHFRIDALAAFFLAVINLGGAGASLFALGYGRHEKRPAGCCRSTQRFSPA